MNFVGVKLFRTPEVLMRPLFGMGEGDVFSTEKLRKGIENMRKMYGKFGYIDFVPEPDFDPIPNTDQIDLTLTADEGKQFFIRRIDFSGNTTTRDKVIRREILLDEGDMFNTQLWDLSILRLNQLGYFEMLKKEDAADIKRNPQSNTVDITLKVKERGKNSIGLNGGVSGIAGSFVGFNYSTNNFLGLGETLSLDFAARHAHATTSASASPSRISSTGRCRSAFMVYLPAVQFQPGPRGLDSGGPEPDSAVQPAGHAEPAELHPEQPRASDFRQLPAAPQFRAPGHHLRLRHLQHQDADHRRRELFPVHQFQRRVRAERAGRHPHQPHHAVVYVQHREPPHHSHRRPQPVHLQRFRRQLPGRQRQHHPPHRGRPSISNRRPGTTSTFWRST